MKEKRVFLITLTSAVFLFLYAPLGVVFAFSFNSKNSIAVFGDLSIRWYEKLFQNQDLLNSLWLSVWIAFVVSVVAVVIGTCLSIGLVKLSRRETFVPNGLVWMVFVTPEIATAAALLVLFSSIKIELSNMTIILSHITFSLAYVVLVVRARLANLAPDLEEAAQDLGATKKQILYLVILPQMWPAIGAAGGLIFLISFDNFVTSLFTSGVGVPPLPVRIYGMIRHGLTPEINAVGTLMTVASIFLLLAGTFIFLRREKKRSSAF